MNSISWIVEVSLGLLVLGAMLAQSLLMVSVFSGLFLVWLFVVVCSAPNGGTDGTE